MKKIFILLFFIISILFPQVVPIESFDGINIDEIPQNIPSISSDELNISFNENAISIINPSGHFSYLIIDSNFDGNYQMKINHANFPQDAYLVFFDQHLNSLYGPYKTSAGEVIFPSVMEGKEIIIIYFEPHNSEFKGHFEIESVQSIENIIYDYEIPNYKIEKTRDRPILMVTGYWPPTNEMIRHFSQDLDLNPHGWEGENWHDLGFDVVSFFLNLILQIVITAVKVMEILK